MEPKKLSEQELAEIRRAEGSATEAILLNHIAALEADNAALAGDSIRQGEAVARFEDAKGKRIRALEDAMQGLHQALARLSTEREFDMSEIDDLVHIAYYALHPELE